MPKAFEDCVAAGGRVVTVSGPSKEHGLSVDEYVKYCYRGGKSYRGHVHTKQKDATKAVAKKARAMGIKK